MDLLGALSRRAAPSDIVDAALAELDVGTDAYLRIDRIGMIDRIELADDIESFDDVMFLGKESGQVEAETRQLAHWYEVKEGVNSYLYRDVFTIGFRTTQYFLSRLAKHGDSGAWVVRTDAGVNSWYGMLFAGDGAEAFCCFSEHVSSVLGAHLAVQ